MPSRKFRSSSSGEWSVHEERWGLSWPQRSAHRTIRLSLIRVRGAHGALLRTPERLEGLRITHGRGELRIYRHRSGAAPVGAGRHELGVARSVARVAPHRAAPSLVAEHP